MCSSANCRTGSNVLSGGPLIAEHSISHLSDRHIRIENFDDGGLSTGPRRIEIYLPDGYDNTADRYPVIYFSDGGNVFSRPGSTMAVDTAYDSLIEEGLIEPAIFVAIGLTSWATRLESFTPTTERGGGLGGYYRFISELLKPYIDSRYRTKPEPESTGIGGYSSGGSAAFIMAYEHPETFGMAACMSPSLWSDREYSLKLLTGDTAEKKPIRFWLDAGGGEYGMWVNVMRAYALMEHLGWTPGDDLAAYFDYAANHNFEAAAGRMREPLRFLLRKEPLKLESYRLVPAVDPQADKIDLGAPRRRIVGAEAWYANGHRLTVPQPGITIADPSIATVDDRDPIQLQGVKSGGTTISSTYQGHTASLPVIGCDPETAFHFLPCPRTDAVPKADECLAEAFELPYKIVNASQKTLARFGVWHDHQHVHIAVYVPTDLIVVESDKLPWQQDCIQINFDARPKADLCDGTSCYDNALSFLLNPSAQGDRIKMYSPQLVQWLPELRDGVQAACLETPDGYAAMLSIPSSYLHEMQGEPWQHFRLNVWTYRAEVPGGPIVETGWQPDWEKFKNPTGTGVFRRE